VAKRGEEKRGQKARDRNRSSSSSSTVRPRGAGCTYVFLLIWTGLSKDWVCMVYISINKEEAWIIKICQKSNFWQPCLPNSCRCEEVAGGGAKRKKKEKEINR
jgi:hypothetical protein